MKNTKGGHLLWKKIEDEKKKKRKKARPLKLRPLGSQLKIYESYDMSINGFQSILSAEKKRARKTFS